MDFLLLAAGLAIGAALALLLERRRRALVDERSRARQREEQEALVEMIGSGLAHEIRNPISTLRMNLQLLREDWEDPITEREQKGRRKIDTLLRETERLESMVSNFLRWAARRELRLEPTDLNALSAEILESLAGPSERAGIRLRQEFAPGLPPVDADPSILRQALLNLLVNAQQAMPGGGEILVRTAANGAHVRLSVTDNGPGMTPDVRDKIFTLYYSTKPGGTGLGLPMVQKILREHQGTVEVETAPGRGATFTLCLKKSGS